MATTPYHLDRVLDSFFDLPTTTWTVNTKSNRYSQTSDQNAYTIVAPMVGIAKSDLLVNVVDNTLVVSATPSVKSRWSAEFKQSWVLAEDADVSGINAKLENGLLTLTVPRTKPATRTVNVTVQ